MTDSVVLCATTQQAWLASGRLCCAVVYDELEDDQSIS